MPRVGEAALEQLEVHRAECDSVVGRWPAASSPASCPARRSTGCAPRTRSRSGPSPPRRRARRCSPASPTAEGLLCAAHRPVDAELIAAAPELRVISNYAVGVDNVDVAAATARGIPVGHTPDVLTDSTADLAVP